MCYVRLGVGVTVLLQIVKRGGGGGGGGGFKMMKSSVCNLFMAPKKVFLFHYAKTFA